jgi:hypothetical protein
MPFHVATTCYIPRGIKSTLTYTTWYQEYTDIRTPRGIKSTLTYTMWL